MIEKKVSEVANVGMTNEKQRKSSMVNLTYYVALTCKTLIAYAPLPAGKMGLSKNFAPPFIMAN